MVMTSENVRFVPAQDLWRSYDDYVLETARRIDAKAVAELGGGANPIVGQDELWGFVPNRVVFDISSDELAKSHTSVEKRVADLCQPIVEGVGAYDLVFSKMLCEHLPDAEVFHRNCFNLLRPGGMSLHFFPTLFAAPFIVNRLLPEDLTRSIVRVVQPGRLDNPKLEKFPAFYNWCKGPTEKNLQRFRSVGFEIYEWRGGYGHTYYTRVPPLQAAEEAKSKFLLRHPVRSLTSFAVIALRKPLA